ncbi:MAG: hypothetical protein WDZ88_00290 [Candidatus Paceibacterota bacterium]
MENIFIKLKEKGMTPGKVVLVVLAIIVLLPIVVWLVAFSFRTAVNPGGSSMSYDRSENSVAPAYYDQRAMEESGGYGGVDGLSQRNIGIYPPQPDISTGNKAEEFEITEYSGTIRSGNAEETCALISGWKSEGEIIFESANTYENGCNFVFKVPKEDKETILSRLEEFSVENLSSNTHTIQPVVADYTSEIEILESKLASIEATLTEAKSAYDEVTLLATRSQDVDALAKIIDSKINLIERLTSQRIDIKNQIEYLLRAKQDQIDRVNYTVFRLNVYEHAIFDMRNIADSWIYALKQFVYEANIVFQGLTIGLIGFFLKVVQAMVYAVIALFIAKYGWRFVRFIWKK